MKPRQPVPSGIHTLAAFLLCATSLRAAIPIAVPQSYAQDFNTLPASANASAGTWSDNATLPGWWVHRANAGTAGVGGRLAGASLAYYTADGSTAANGTPNLHGPLDLGAGGDGNRTFGASPTTSLGEISLIVLFQNTSAEFIDLANLAFDVRVFRSNSSTTDAETLTLTWKTGVNQAALLAELDGSGAVGPLGAMPSLGYAPVNPALNHTHSTSVSGEFHSPPLTTPKGGAPTATIRMQPGEFLALRWGNVNDGGTDAMMGIDNLVLSFTQPSAAITGSLSNVSRNLNGTLGDASDDFISFNMTATGSGGISPTGWKIAGPAPFGGPATFPYGTGMAQFTDVPISAFAPTYSVPLRLEDADSPAVVAFVTVAPPLADAYVTVTRSHAISFSEAPTGSASFARTEGSSDFGWNGGSTNAAVRIQPAPGPSSSKYFDINNAKPTLLTESVNVTEVDALKVTVNLAAYTTSATAFEANDTLTVTVETSASGDFNDTVTVSWLVDPVVLNGTDLFSRIRVSDPGINYGTIAYPSTAFPFVPFSTGIPRGAATRARVRIRGGNDSASEHTLIDNIAFAPFTPQPGDDSDGDGISDLVEMQRQVGGQSAPTNPFSVDTDGDGLSDAIETGTGTYVSAANTGSDPLRIDSDNDGTLDGNEVSGGTDPNDPASGFVQFVATDEEFNGPFPSWKNVKTDFGAVGDGVADDTTAIQAALTWFKDMPNVDASVLYFPAGTYRLTSTLLTTRAAHNDYLGFEMVGEDPATTRLVWNGPARGTMLQLDQWYGKVSRLTFDGTRTAGRGLYREGAFSTYGEISDCFFLDMERGIQFGGAGNGQAETFINRCRFSRITENAILVTNFNSLDIWVWNSLFHDCATGLLCAAGNFHAFKNVFLRSSGADVVGNSFMYDLTRNVSVGSYRFADWFTGFIDPLSINVLLRGNRVYDFTGDFAMAFNQVGPYFFLDNVIKNRPGDTTTSLAPGGNALVLGNRFSVSPAVEPQVIGQAPNGIVREMDSIHDSLLETPSSVSLPRTPPQVARTVFEVASGTGDDAAALQNAISAAAASLAERPVVHIGKGQWTIARTVIIPALRDIQIIGDGGSHNGTALVGSGARKYLLRLRGPSRATLRDFQVGDDSHDGILVENANQIGGRVYAEQLSAAVYSSNGLVLHGIDDSDVTLSGAGIGSVSVTGGPKLSGGLPADGQTSIFGGAGDNAIPIYSVKNGGRLLSEAVYHEVTEYSRFNAIDLEPGQHGALTVALGRLTYASSPTTPLIRANDWQGQLSLVGNFYVVPGGGFNAQSHWLDLRGDGSQMQALVLGGAFSTLPGPGEPLTQTDFIFRDTTSPAAEAAFYLASKANDSTGSSYALNAQYRQTPAAPEDDYLRSMLAMLREARIEGPSIRPEGVTDLKLYRILTGVNSGTSITSVRVVGATDERAIAPSQPQAIRFSEAGVGADNYTRSNTGASDLNWFGGTSTARVGRQPSPGPQEPLYFDINNARIEFVTEEMRISGVEQIKASIRLAAYTTSSTAFEPDDTVDVIVETSVTGIFDDAVEVARLVNSATIDGTALFDLLKISDPGTNLGVATPYTSESFPFVLREITFPRGSAVYARLRLVGGNNSASEHLLVDDIVFSDATPSDPDSDHDGLPDAWEREVFGNVESQSGENDADGDGANNLHEFQAGTNPIDSTSFFGLASITRTGNTMELTWSSVPGKVYRIFTSSTLGSPEEWIDVGDDFAASPASTTSTTIDITLFPENRLFVRIAIKGG